MAKRSKATVDPDKRKSVGKHGGNRGATRNKEKEQPKGSSQAAGKDPQRGRGKD
jgi:hypothetical protein